MVEDLALRPYIHLVAFIGFICACAQQPDITTKPKLVSLSPAMTEIIFALHAEHHLVGVTTYCDYPEAAQHLYKVGDFSNPSLERIVGQHPDLIIVNLPEHARIKRQLENLGKKVFVSSPVSLEIMYHEIRTLGELLERTVTADSLINAMKAVIHPHDCSAKKNIYIELSPRPLITIGNKSFLNELLQMAGGVNIFTDIPKDYPVVQQEEVIRRNPDIILVLHPENIMNRIGWENISAVEEKTVYAEIDPDILLRPAPRLILGFQELLHILHE